MDPRKKSIIYKVLTTLFGILLIQHPLCDAAATLEDKAAAARNVEEELGEATVMSCIFKLEAVNDLGFVMIHNTPQLTMMGAAGAPAGSIQVNPIFQEALFSDVNITVSSPVGNADGSLTVNVTIIIPSVRRPHEGQFKCLAGADNKIYNLLVLGPPQLLNLIAISANLNISKLESYDMEEFPDSLSVWKAEINIDMDIPSEIEAAVQSNPPASNTWTAVNGDKTVTGTTISLNTDELMDRYKFTASNDYGSSSVSLIIDPQYKPRPPRISDSDLYPEQGKIAKASCEFDANPPATVFYVKENPATKAWTRISTQTGELYIATVDLDDHVGTYKCVGENKLGNSTGIIRVHAKPRDVTLTVGGIYGNSLDLQFHTFSALPVKFNLTISYNKTNALESRTYVIDQRGPQVVPNIEIVHIASDLEPNTDYSVHLVAWNKYGSAESEVMHVSTSSVNVTRPPTPSTTAEMVTRPATVAPTTTRPVKAEPDNSGSQCMLSSLLVTILSLLILRIH